MQLYLFCLKFLNYFGLYKYIPIVSKALGLGKIASTVALSFGIFAVAGLLVGTVIYYREEILEFCSSNLERLMKALGLSKSKEPVLKEDSEKAMIHEVDARGVAQEDKILENIHILQKKLQV